MLILQYGLRLAGVEYEILDKCNINLPDTKINKHNYFNIEDFIKKC